MRVALLIVCAALALSACERKDANQESSLGNLASPRLAGRLYTCNLSYIAVRGPIVAESRAQVRMGVDTGLAAGWKVESVSIVTPLPDAGDFDPWLPFMPGIERRFVAQEGSKVTLAVSDGVPMTLDTATGDLNWSKEGVLGETEYTGGCY